MRELKPTRQIDDEPARRWFAGQALDLIAWFDADEQVTGFQLCYAKGRDEHALTWWRGKGFSHDRIDDGEGRPDDQKMAPILVPDGSFDKAGVLAQLRAHAADIDPALVAFVERTIEGYPRG